MDPSLHHLVSPLESATLGSLKNHVFQDDHRDTTENRLVRIGFGPLASNRPYWGAVLVLNGVFGRDTFITFHFNDGSDKPPPVTAVRMTQRRFQWDGHRRCSE